MRKKINSLSIKKKIIFYIYLVISPILILITTFIYITNYRDVKAQQIEADINLARSLDESIEVIQTDVADLSVYICINNDILSILKTDNPDRVNEDARVWYNNGPMQIIQDIISLKGYIKTIAIYPENGVNPYLRCIDFSSYVPEMSEIRKTGLYGQAVENNGEALWQFVGKGQSGIYQANYADKIVMYREILDLSKQRRLGFMAIGINASKFTDLCKNVLQSEQEGVVVLSSRGAELTRYGEIDQAVLEHIQREEFISTDYRKREPYFTYGKYHVFCSQASKKGVIVCKMAPVNSNNGQLRSIAISAVLMLLGMLVGILPLLILVSNIISKPLAKLSAAMQRFQEGDFNQKVEVISQDEIGAVTECFNHMVESIRELIDNNYVMALKEKESELIALQAQINPHFLYNTLDSLYWRAQDTGNEELAEDIFALSQLFRMVLGEGKGIIRVEQEKELIERYLQIQKMRFGKRMEYEVVFEEEICGEEIPKLILQPFVENAIVHGIENSKDVKEAGRLYVGGRRSGEYLEFIIKDNGSGMNEEQLKAVWETEDSKRYKGQRVGRYAIKNVKERLALKYQEDFELGISSKPGQGTSVTIRIPRRMGKTGEGQV